MWVILRQRDYRCEFIVTGGKEEMVLNVALYRSLCNIIVTDGKEYITELIVQLRLMVRTAKSLFYYY
jgi:hypothetical protein